MVNKIREQQQNVNDTCSDCGSFVDIGTVIDEHDTELTLVFNGENAKNDAQNIANKATERFEHVIIHMTDLENSIKLTMTFSVTVEKMLFQLENRC
ncbi:YfcZ/YiiS family protein [Shewanella subflava]|uniref:YfcZ/YiiS family protein n=1 Tax=Shewanella subflava TaxID=2986476 RepID=A0ABT3ICS1_9GAMM|nr:YfcZ/YiiS family protein [Shewanella subflava]MCW3173856.1 YfcZ/YiiS family protein [Shewanella subflava]